MSLAWFNALYIVWALYWREGATYARHVFAAPTFLRRIVSEFFYAVIYGFVLLVLCLSWFIGLTRFWDDLHNISDIIGGFLCALIFTTPAFLAAVGQYNVFQEAMDYDEIQRQKRKLGTAASWEDDGNELPTVAFNRPNAAAVATPAAAPAGAMGGVELQQQQQQQDRAAAAAAAGGGANNGGGHVVVNMPSTGSSGERHRLF